MLYETDINISYTKVTDMFIYNYCFNTTRHIPPNIGTCLLSGVKIYIALLSNTFFERVIKYNIIDSIDNSVKVCIYYSNLKMDESIVMAERIVNKKRVDILLYCLSLH